MRMEIDVPSLRDVLICANCRQRTSALRGLCIQCGHTSVYSLSEALNGALDLVNAEDWLPKLLAELLLLGEPIDAPLPVAHFGRASLVAVHPAYGLGPEVGESA
jgi:hypothetical protein